MPHSEVLVKLRDLMRPYVQDPAALESASEETELIGELSVNSMHLIDIVIDAENAFGVEITEDDMDGLRTVGDVVNIIVNKTVANKGETQ